MGRGDSSSAGTVTVPGRNQNKRSQVRSDAFLGYLTSTGEESYLLRGRPADADERGMFIRERIQRLDYSPFMKGVNALGPDDPTSETMFALLEDAFLERGRQNTDALSTVAARLGFIGDGTDPNSTARDFLAEKFDYKELSDLVNAGGAIFAEANKKYPVDKPDFSVREQQNKTTAEALGAELPETGIEFGMDPTTGFRTSTGKYRYGPQEEEASSMYRNSLERGQRAFAFYGPAGSGKSAFIRELAAIQNSPYLKVGSSGADKSLIVEDAEGRRGVLPTNDPDLLARALSSPACVEFESATAVDPTLQKITAQEEAVAQQIIADALRNNKSFKVSTGDARGRVTSDVAAGMLTPDAATRVFFSFNPNTEDARLQPQTQKDLLSLHFSAQRVGLV